mgnify:CR=1 FL=1
MISESEVLRKAMGARRAAPYLARAATDVKNRALLAIARVLDGRPGEILTANRQDVEAATASGISAALVDRLTLTEKRIDEITAAIKPLEHRGHGKAKYAQLRRSSKPEALLSRSKYDPRECAARGCR